MAEMYDSVFRAFLDWLMVSDPFPLDDADHERVVSYLNAEAQDRGYDTWVHAYHELGVTADG